ncbi:hypothetical protein Tco_0698114 [Tanacetum coccineum]
MKYADKNGRRSVPAKETGAKRKKSIPKKDKRRDQKMEEDAERWENSKRTLETSYQEKLVKERYSTSRPEGFDLMLWGDLHTLFEPDKDDEIWKDQHEYIYKLGDYMILVMLKKKLEVDHESSQAIELLSFGEVLRLKKSNHFSSGSTTPLSDSCPSFTSFETSDLLLEEFANELTLIDPFPPANEDVDVEAELREIKLLLNRDPSTKFSLKITFDPNPERFTDEPALVCLPPPGDDKSFLNKDVQKENFQIYSNPLFEFDDEYISSDVNPLFDEAIEDIKCKDSYDFNLDPSISVVSIFGGFTDEPPLEENDDLFDLECKTNNWKKILYDAPIDDMIFDPGGDIDEINAFLDDYKDSRVDVLEILHNTTHNLFPEVFFDHEPQCFKDELLLTYPMNFLFSFESEDTIFNPGIYAFHFSSLEPVAFESQMEVCSSTCFISKDE